MSTQRSTTIQGQSTPSNEQSKSNLKTADDVLLSAKKHQVSPPSTKVQSYARIPKEVKTFNQHAKLVPTQFPSSGERVRPTSTSIVNTDNKAVSLRKKEVSTKPAPIEPGKPTRLSKQLHVTNPKTPLIPNQTKALVAKPRLSQAESSFNSNRVASKGTVGMNKEAIQSRLRKKSPWYDSIMSPITGGGVKIPDPVGTDTGTYQHIENVTVSVTAGGIAGLRICSPYINSYDSSQGFNYQVSIPSVDVANISWGQGTTLGAPIPFARIPALMKSNARTHRIVSCSVIAQTEVSTLSDAGEMVAFVTPFGMNVNASTALIPYTQYQQQWDSSILPVNAHKPLMARWYPLESSFNYFTGGTFPPQNDSYISYRDFVDPNLGSEVETEDLGVIPWEIGVACKGMTPSTGVVRFQIVVNYEFIPLFSTAMVSADPSPIDPMEEQLVNYWVAQDPVTAVVSQKEASKAPRQTSVPEEPSGFGMLYNVIEEMMPSIAKTVPKLLSLL